VRQFNYRTIAFNDSAECLLTDLKIEA